ncbi:MAG: WbqC family protein [Bdellovibrionales bacterium]
MRVVINQPNYIPWRGYFDLIDDANIFLFHDDVQYTKQDWRNRNRIKSKDGLIWLTVPVQSAQSGTLIKDVRISYAQDWPRRHRCMTKEAYGKAPYFELYADRFFTLLDKNFTHLIDLDIALTQLAMEALNIKTPLARVSELKVPGHKTEKLINILTALGAEDYLSGPAAKSYIDEKAFQKHGFGLTWKHYRYDPYPQLWGVFESQVSVFDLLFNCGPKSRNYLKSKAAFEPVIELKSTDSELGLAQSA